MRHQVNAYLASHILAFDVQAHDGVLQIPPLVRRWIRQGYQPAEAAAEVRRSLDVPGGPDGGMLDRYIRPEPERPYQPQPPFEPQPPF